MTEDVLEHKDEEIAELRQQIRGINERLTPDALAKTIDRSFLSVNNLRAFLQIFALILTVFLAGAVYFGWVGLSNILKIKEEAQRTESIRLSTQEILKKVSKIETQVGEKVAAVDEAIPALRKKTEEEMANFSQEVTERVQNVDKEMKEIAKNLKDISQIFNNIGISKQELLNAREMQLLILLAKEIDPDNPIFNLNAAHWALSFRRYDEAIDYLDVVLQSEGISPDIRNRSEKLKSQAEQYKANPPKLEYKKPSGAMVGPYGIFEFPLNILDALVRNGYLTVDQAQEIIEGSKNK